MTKAFLNGAAALLLSSQVVPLLPCLRLSPSTPLPI